MRVAAASPSPGASSTVAASTAALSTAHRPLALSNTVTRARTPSDLSLDSAPSRPSDPSLAWVACVTVSFVTSRASFMLEAVM